MLDLEWNYARIQHWSRLLNLLNSRLWYRRSVFRFCCFIVIGTKYSFSTLYMCAVPYLPNFCLHLKLLLIMMLMVDNFMHPFVAIIHAGFEGNYKVNQNAFPHWEYQEQHIQRICCNDLIWIRRDVWSCVDKMHAKLTQRRKRKQWHTKWKIIIYFN